MKSKILITGIFYSFLLIFSACNKPSCDNGEQDGEETGVDCGGSECTPCVTEDTTDTTPEVVDSNLIYLQQKWYLQERYTEGSSTFYTSYNSSYIYYKFANECAVEFTDAEISENKFELKGSLQNCSYPTSSNYLYNAGLKTVLINTDVFTFNYIEPNEMEIIGEVYAGNFSPLAESINTYRTSPKITIQDTLDWELTLNDFYPRDNELKIVVLKDNVEVSSVLINSSQKVYTGEEIVFYGNNTPGSSFEYKIRIEKINPSQTNPSTPDYFTYSITSLINGKTSSEMINETRCIGEPNCNGLNLTSATDGIVLNWSF